MNGDLLKMNPKSIYIASPYTKGDTCWNVRRQHDLWEILRSLGHMPFAPLWSHYQHMIQVRSWDCWMEWDLHWLRKCDAVFRLAGESVGADREVQVARDENIPVYHNLFSALDFLGIGTDEHVDLTSRALSIWNDVNSPTEPVPFVDENWYIDPKNWNNAGPIIQFESPIEMSNPGSLIELKGEEVWENKTATTDEALEAAKEMYYSKEPYYKEINVDANGTIRID